MSVFWIMAALMTAVALSFVLVPLLRARSRAGPTAVAANLDVLRGQRREIDADVANGLLPASSRDEALAELVDRAQDDLAAIPAAVPGDARKSWTAAVVVAVALPAAAFGIYLALGTPSALDTGAIAHDGGNLDDKQILAMVESLAAKVRKRPDDAQGWALLARSMAALGRFKEAVDAYEHLLTLVPRDPQTLADYADVLGMAQGRTLAGRPYEIAKEALSIDPLHKKALALAGTAAMDENDFAAALGHWQALAAQLPPGSDDERQVRAIIGELRTKATAAGKVLPAERIAKAPVPASVPGSVSGSVSVAPPLTAQVSNAATLFIFARAEGGARMPLAVLRRSASELPMSFALDDSMAMTPATKISGAPAVRIEARISRSGNATPQPGDLVGTSGIVKPGARDVKIVVDKVLP
ncbi:MAG TPA: c-type cytochrome biogenesis protein CcmI [Usitatibacter sp.]